MNRVPAMPDFPRREASSSSGHRLWSQKTCIWILLLLLAGFMTLGNCHRSFLSLHFLTVKLGE